MALDEPLRDCTLQLPAWTRALHTEAEMTHLFGRGLLLWNGLSSMNDEQPLAHGLIVIRDPHIFIFQ